MKPASYSDPDTMSVERICACFWAAETKFSLLSWSVNGVYPWPLMRMQLYYRITQQVGLFENPHPTFKSQAEAARARLSSDSSLASYWKEQERRYKFRSIRALGKRAFDLATFAGLLSGTKDLETRYGLLSATRKINGKEPYTDALRKELGDRVMVIDRALDGEPVDGALDLVSIADLFRKRYKPRKPAPLSQEHRLLCEKIQEHFSQELKIDVGDLAKVTLSRIREFVPLVTGFNILFTLNPVDVLFLTNSYGTTVAAALCAARQNGARIVELQHGFISPFHLGYSWPGRPEVPYKPDELWCFGDFWHESTPLPGQTQARVIGAPYVHELAKLGDLQREENLVVFTSQGVIGRRLLDIALTTARRRPDKQIIFRLHPSEALEDYEAALREAGPAPANFELSHKTPNIFALLAKTSIQVGAFSTTLFEGMSLGCRTIVIDLPGAEYMRPVVGKGDVLFVRNADELIEQLDNAPLAADPEYYYAQPAPHLV